MNNRAYAVDILRGLAIVGMVLSGYIAWNPDLPAWLFYNLQAFTVRHFQVG